MQCILNANCPNVHTSTPPRKRRGSAGWVCLAPWHLWHLWLSTQKWGRPHRPLPRHMSSSSGSGRPAAGRWQQAQHTAQAQQPGGQHTGGQLVAADAAAAAFFSLPWNQQGPVAEQTQGGPKQKYKHSSGLASGVPEFLFCVSWFFVPEFVFWVSWYLSLH